MQLPLGLGRVDFTDWLRGLLGAFIQGGASAVTASFVASSLTKDLSIGSAKFFELVATVFLINGTMGFFSFLRDKPLPELKTVTTTVQTTEKVKPAATIVTTVQETHQEPVIEPVDPKA